MSTRCNIEFLEEGERIAMLYRHCDGMPEGVHGVLAALDTFFSSEEFKKNAGDGIYTVSDFICWHTAHVDQIGVTPEVHADIDYLYKVDLLGKNQVITYAET